MNNRVQFTEDYYVNIQLLETPYAMSIQLYEATAKEIRTY